LRSSLGTPQTSKLIDLKSDLEGRAFSSSLFFLGIIGTALIGVIFLGVFTVFSFLVVAEIAGLVGAWHFYKQYALLQGQINQ
jgi:hypothetical protein